MVVDFTNLKVSIRSAYTDQLVHWQRLLLIELNQMTSVLEDWLQKDEMSSGPATTIDRDEEYLELLEQMLQICRDWKFPRCFSNEAEITEVFSRKFEIATTGLTESSRINLEDDYWSSKKDETYIVRIWKTYNRVRNSISRSILHSSNWVRKLFRQPTHPIPKRTRTLNLREFIEVEMKFPLLKQLMLEWKQFQLFYSVQIESLQNEVVKLREKSFALSSSSELEDSQISDIDKVDTVKSILNIVVRNADTDQESILIPRLNFDEMWAQLESNATKHYEFAGTAIFPSSRFDQKVIKSTSYKSIRDFNRVTDIWSTHLHGVRAEFIKNLELTVLQYKIELAHVSTRKKMQDKIHSSVNPVIVDGIDLVEKSLERFKADIAGKDKGLKSSILDENRKLLHSLRTLKIPNMIDAVVRFNLRKETIFFLWSLETAIEALSDNHVIFVDKAKESLLPHSKTEEIPLKELVAREIFPKVKKKHSDHINELDERQKGILRGLSKIDQIVEFNLEAALNLLGDGIDEQSGDDPREVVKDGLERALNQLNEILEKLSLNTEIAATNITDMRSEFISDLNVLTVNEKIIELKVRLTKAKAHDKLTEYRAGILNKIRVLIPKILNDLVKSANFVRAHVLRIGKITGLSTEVHRMEDVISDFVQSAETRRKQLPYVYKRLFRTDPLDDQRFFNGRINELKAIEHHYSSWLNGVPTSIVLVGEKGNGKTSLINYAVSNTLKDARVSKIYVTRAIKDEIDLINLLSSSLNIGEVSDISGLESELLNGDRRVVVLENFNNLFTRKVNGFELLNDWLQLMVNTKNSVFWIASCSVYSWQYLERVININNYFGYKMELGSLLTDTIRDIILNRHGVSGFELTYNLPVDKERARKYDKLGTPQKIQEALENDFFTRLSEMADGNISIAILHWLRCITGNDDVTINISPIKDLDYTTLFQLDMQSMFTLVALLRHGDYTLEHHLEVFNCTVEKGRLELQNLCHQKILVEEDGYYRINQLLYRPVVRALKSRNVLH